MSTNRTVIIHMDVQHETDHTEWYRAIGYLSTWNMTFPTVNIYKDGDTDLYAVYSDEAGDTKYVIGAVWHGDHYGFHS